ncbi:MAG: PAS domain S-box protein [Campylobacterota bacterium]|nr:PAS domain S-box protein [Campylobacterota bacterium]
MPFDLVNLSKADSSLLKLLTLHLPDMLWIKDLDGVYIYANQAICDGLLMADDIDEPIGKTDIFFALREREKYKDRLDWHTFGELCFDSDKQVIEANKPMKFEEFGNVKGKMLYLEVHKAPFYDKDGNIIGVVGSGRDITELKMTQLRLSEQAQIIEQIQDCIITTDMQGTIISWNISAQNLFGYESDEIVGKNIDTLYTKENSSSLKQAVVDFIENEEYNGKVVLKDKSDQTIITDITLSLLKDEIDKNIRIIYYIKDITDKEKLNEAVIKQDRIIANQAHHVSMGEMIGNIAHQWRQPLSVISSSATGLLVQKEFGTLTDDMFNETCHNINDNAQYLSKTIDDFRNFIKGDRKQARFDLSSDIDSFLHLVQGEIKSSQIILETNIEDDITIFGYPNELIQCFINIFNNSKDEFKNIKSKRYFFITTYSEGKNAVIILKDNAGGIPADILPKIFDPYFTTKEESNGTGLGLNMTHDLIINGMGGDIEASNTTYDHNGEKYKGAQFKIMLPFS